MCNKKSVDFMVSTLGANLWNERKAKIPWTRLKIKLQYDRQWQKRVRKKIWLTNAKIQLVRLKQSDSFVDYPEFNAINGTRQKEKMFIRTWVVKTFSSRNKKHPFVTTSDEWFTLWVNVKQNVAFFYGLLFHYLQAQACSAFHNSTHNSIRL